MKKLIFTVMSILLILSLCGCLPQSGEKPEEPEEPETVVFEPGWPVTVAGVEMEKAPGKVACLSPALCEYISDSGYADRLCLISEGCLFGGAEKYRTAGTRLSPDIDALAAEGTEYLLAVGSFDDETMTLLQQKNIRILSFESPRSIDDVKSLMRDLAYFFEGSETGAASYESALARYESLIDSVMYTGSRKSALFLRCLDDLAITSDSLCGEILGLAFDNAAGESTGFVLTGETIESMQPDVIFLGGDLRIRDLESSDLYKKKTAVKGDCVFACDLDSLAVGSERSFKILYNMMATAYEDFGRGEKLEPAYPSLYS